LRIGTKRYQKIGALLLTSTLARWRRKGNRKMAPYVANTLVTRKSEVVNVARTVHFSFFSIEIEQYFRITYLLGPCRTFHTLAIEP
jgi:hypothetical protein